MEFLFYRLHGDSIRFDFAELRPDSLRASARRLMLDVWWEETIQNYVNNLGEVEKGIEHHHQAGVEAWTIRLFEEMIS